MRVFLVSGWFIASLFFTAARAWAVESDVDRLLEFLIKEKVITQEKATEFRAELAVKKQEEKQPTAVPDWVQNIKLKGDFRLREDWKKDKGQDDLSRTRIRVRLGLEAKVNPKLKFALGIATGSPKDARSRDITLGTTGETTNTDWDPGSPKSIVLDYAFAEWKPAKWATFTGGKYQNPLWRPADIIWKPDITPEGAAFNFNYNLSQKFSLFMNDMLFILRNPDTNGGKQPILFALQPGVSIDFTDNTNVKFAVTGYTFNQLKGSPKFVYSKAGNSSSGGTGQSGNTLTSSGTYKYNYNAINPSVEIGFKKPFGGLLPYVSVYGDYIYNVSLPSSATGAGGFDIGVKFGDESVTDWGKWQAKITYQKLGRDSWVDAFTDNNRYSGKTNAKVYKASLDYGVGKNTWLTFSYYYGESLTKLPANTAATSYNGPGRAPENAIQADWNLKF